MTDVRSLRSSCATGVALVLVLTAAVPGLAREKTDVVTLRNGDRITGEIRQFLLGELTVKTDTMGTISIEWPEVVRIESRQLFEVEDEDGNKAYGEITPADEEGRFKVIGDDGETALEHDRIVRIAIIDESWKERWRGFVDLGYSYHSANRESQGSLSAQATYRSKKFQLRGDLSAAHSSREDAVSTSWSTVTLRYERFLANRWFWTEWESYEQNEEIELDMRATIGGGFGRYLVQTNRTVLAAYVGVSANRERYLGDEEGTETTGEGILATTYNFFIFGDHETLVSASLSLLPSLTTSGRYRVEAETSLRREMIADFTVSLTLSDSFDSDPPVAGAQKNDFRLVTSLGWTF